MYKVCRRASERVSLLLEFAAGGGASELSVDSFRIARVYKGKKEREGYIELISLLRRFFLYFSFDSCARACACTGNGSFRKIWLGLAFVRENLRWEG